MMTMRKLALIAVAFVSCLHFLPSMAIAQAGDLPARQSTGLKRISGVEGDWRTTSLRWDRLANTWVDAPPESAIGEISFHRMDHGKAFRLAFNSPAYKVDGFLSYDVWNDRYVLVSIDNQIGQIDVQQGGFDGDRLILDNLKADTTYKVRSLTTHTRLELYFEAGNLSVIQVDSSQDQGKTWQHTSLFRVQRTAAARK